MHSALAGLVNQGSSFLNEGVVAGRLGNRHPSITPYETFAASDGELVVACGNDAIFRSLCRALGLDGLAGDPRFATNPARAAHREELAEALSEVLAGATVTEWVERLRAARVPAGPVNDVAAAFALAAELGLGAVDETGGVRTVAPPFGLSATPAEVRLPPPALGEHDAELRAWLEGEPG
jgi:crotonobetainyl-CoA:carnitine CoA-transferase CaiB-like acyl-CoA transferase